MPAHRKIDVDRLIQLHGEGKTDRDIAKSFDCSHVAIWQWRQLLDLPANGVFHQ